MKDTKGLEHPIAPTAIRLESPLPIHKQIPNATSNTF